MAKKTGKKPSVLRNAANLRAQYRRWLMWFIGVLALCIVVLAVYWVLVIQGIVDSASLDMLPWALALVAAGVVGVLGNKFSKAHREYEDYLANAKLVNNDVIEFIKSNK